MDDTRLTTDEDAVRKHLEAVLETTVETVSVLADGLNVVLEAETSGGSIVIRRPTDLRETDLFVDLETEYRVMEHLSSTRIRTPEPLVFVDESTTLEGPWFAMRKRAGDPVPLGSTLPARFQDPASRRRLATELLDTLAAIHTLETRPVAPVLEHVPPVEQIERAMTRLEAAESTTNRAWTELRTLGQRLRVNAPATVEPTLVHGDYRPGNCLFAGTDRPALTAVLDWETAMLGDPHTELGYLLLRWHDAGDTGICLEEIERAFDRPEALADIRRANREGLAPFTGRPGSPTRGDLVERYERQTGRRFRADRFYRAHAAFLLATVWVDLHRRTLEAGQRSDREPHIAYMTALAGAVLDGDLPL